MSLETEILLLKQDISRISMFSDKLDAAIIKMGEVSNDIAKMLAVHQERLDTQETTDEELFTLMEKLKDEMKGDIKDLHSRITTVSRDLSDDINETEQRLMQALTYGMNDLKKCIVEDIKQKEQSTKDLEARVAELEKWKWIILGGSMVLGSVAHEILDLLLP